MPQHRAVTAAAICAALTAAHTASAGPQPVTLLGPHPHIRAPYYAGDQWVIQGRWATTDAAALRDTLLDPHHAPVRLNLFEDADFLVRTVRVDQPAHAVLHWVGRIDAPVAGDVTLVHRAGVIAAHVRTQDNRVYQLVSDPDGVTSVKQIDTNAMPGCAGALSPEAHAIAQAVAQPKPNPHAIRPGRPTHTRTSALNAETQRATTPYVDVLVAYTPATINTAGTAAAAEALIDLAILDSNTIYELSGVDLRIRAAVIMLTNYTESGSLSTDLSRIRTAGNGFMDEVHQVRDDFGADMVALVTSAAAGGACGVAYLMQSPSVTFANAAFSVTAITCFSNLTFTHELGHNQGLQHDTGNAGAPPSHPFAYGYRTPDNVYRTVMAYAPGARIPRFSNPDVIFNGYPMGVPIGEVGETHNAHALNLNAPFITQWRSEQPVRITDLAATKGGSPDSVALTWTPLTGATSYKVYRDFSFQILASNANQIGVAPAPGGFTDNIVVENTAYTYWIRPVMPEGVGALSNTDIGFTGQPLSPDMNEDGYVDGRDLGILLGYWGVTGPSIADLNFDGVVNGADLGILLGAWTGPP